MLRLDLKQQKKVKTPIEKMAEAIVDGVDAIREKGKQVIGEVKGFFTGKKAKQKDIVIKVDPIATGQVVDQEKELLRPALRLLGEESKEKIVFLKTLHEKTGLQIKDIALAIEELLKNELSVEQLLRLEIDDAIAIFKMWKVGKITSLSAYDIYNTLPKEVKSRADVWLEKITLTITCPAGSGATTLEEILRFYTAFSAEEFIKESIDSDIKHAYRLFKIIIRLGGGYALPLSTLQMTAVWALMLKEMRSITPPQDSALKNGAVFLALWISLVAHMAIEGVESIYGKLLNVASSKVSEDVKDLFFSFHKALGGDTMNAKKYLAWNKTAGVLIEKETLDMSGATRMLTTYTIGKCFIRCLTAQMNIKGFLQGLSPIPGKRTIHDVLTLFRLPEKYSMRCEMVYKELDGLVKGKPSESDLITAGNCYFELLKLKLAYAPEVNYGKNGVIIDPEGSGIDTELIDNVVERAFMYTNRNLFTRLRRWGFKKELKISILQSPNKKYIDYFGEPKLSKKKTLPERCYE